MYNTQAYYPNLRDDDGRTNAWLPGHEIESKIPQHQRIMDKAQDGTVVRDNTSHSFFFSFFFWSIMG